MFGREYEYVRAMRRSVAKSRELLNIDGQRRWRVNEDGAAEGIFVPGRCIYAQNDAYLELANPGFGVQSMVTSLALLVLLSCLLMVWVWYGLALHPLLFGRVLFLSWNEPYESAMLPLVIGGWTIMLFFVAGFVFFVYMMFVGLGARTAFFSPLRGRVRFNRKTRQVYVLRPGYCGGDKVFAWGRLEAVLKPFPARMEPKVVRYLQAQPLVLYHPPFSADDAAAVGEDVIFIESATVAYYPEGVAGLWEYIRRYMEEGPSIDVIPPNAPTSFKQVPRYLPPAYSTYCGMPSAAQCRFELEVSFYLPLYMFLAQSTCYWPRFPKAWESDSGIGEPEERPVQAGAVMTAMVYRAKGKLAKADEVDFMKRWGTAEGLNDAMAR
ncbi:DUF6708 domain-containing protein [Cupriavidus nantongensis]|uniref:DUF6708 domain-containing protein n=1 Tax=Cupriavidus nantongensis TaxID=1796606 RepID=UPI002247440E|nr:DUF6708 domain-containing protein [Cupriavidus nantongensis]